MMTTTPSAPAVPEGASTPVGSPPRGPYVCGVDAAMDVLRGKWKASILWELGDNGVRRYGVLKRRLPGVSDKVLQLGAAGHEVVSA